MKRVIITSPHEDKPCWRIGNDLFLYQEQPRQGETERWETGVLGPHPCQVTLVLFEDSSQWMARVNHTVGYGGTALEALHNARERAVDMLHYSISRIENMTFDFMD